jgi:hypothetical protein
MFAQARSGCNQIRSGCNQIRSGSAHARSGPAQARSGLLSHSTGCSLSAHATPLRNSRPKAEMDISFHVNVGRYIYIKSNWVGRPWRVDSAKSCPAQPRLNSHQACTATAHARLRQSCLTSDQAGLRLLMLTLTVLKKAPPLLPGRPCLAGRLFE